VWKQYRKTATVWAKKMDSDFEIETLEGVMQGHAGDYLCHGEHEGEAWPVRGDIFENTYVEVEGYE